MGSVISCNEESFKKINGNPNHYWGWGNEDVDLTLRILEKNVNAEIKDFLYMTVGNEPVTQSDVINEILATGPTNVILTLSIVKAPVVLINDVVGG